MAGPNLLIGNGQVLAGPTPRLRGGSSNSKFVYSLDQARARLGPLLAEIVDALDQLPERAKPRGQGTVVITVHPRHLAKTRMPQHLMQHSGLRMLGSKGTWLVPEQDLPGHEHSEPQAAAEIYMAGTSASFRLLRRFLLASDTSPKLQRDFRTIERIRLLQPIERMLRLDGDDAQVALELVVHGDGSDDELLDALEKYAQDCGVQLGRSKLLIVPPLVFMPALAPRTQLESFAKFTALRAVRRLPELRMNRPMRTAVAGAAPALPEEDCLDPSLRVVAFDGGLGVQDFGRWCKEEVPPALNQTDAEYLLHGNDVTSALLFGPADEGARLPRPFFNVEHQRVIGTGNGGDADLYDSMHRVDQILRSGDVDFANLSLGPRMCIDDDQPHAWTAMLDKHLAKGRTFVTVAVGNDGILPNKQGRIQPPADAINALAVGSADSREFMWGRADYSCYGPGRSPGLVKPDGLAYGGTEQHPLVLLNPFARGLTGVYGTSFAAPLALRTAAGARALCATPLTATALRALMIHKAERSEKDDRHEVGWGRFAARSEDLLTCGDHEVSVLYQGTIKAGGRMRIGVPVPPVAMGVKLTITATFCFSTQVDPADPVNYTRHGLSIFFKPKDDEPAPFFSLDDYETEQDLRADGNKWETVLHKTARFDAAELLDAYFDVDHAARRRGLAVENKNVGALPYVLVVTVASDKGETIYEAVRLKYKQLQPIELRTRIRLGT